jgi:hypothetical protein
MFQNVYFRTLLYAMQPLSTDPSTVSAIPTYQQFLYRAF